MKRLCMKCHEPKDEVADFYQSPFYKSNVCKECRRLEGRRNRAKTTASKEAQRLAKIEQYIIELNRKWSEG